MPRGGGGGGGFIFDMVGVGQKICLKRGFILFKLN
jgi:hypothetical protein